MTPRKKPASMVVEQIDVNALVPDEDNARRGDVDALMESLREFGQHRAIVVQRGTNKVLIGNHLLAAAKALGWPDVAVTYVDDEDDKALRRSLADNMVGDRAGWDNAQLASLLAELGDEAISLPGVDDKLLNSLLPDADSEVEAPALLPIALRPGEYYDYVVIVSQNEVDSTWLESNLGLRRERSWKNTAVGASRVVSVEDFRAGLNQAIERGEKI